MVRCVFCLFGRKASLTKILLMMAFFKLTIDNIVPVQKPTRVTHFIITVDSNKIFKDSPGFSCNDHLATQQINETEQLQ